MSSGGFDYARLGLEDDSGDNDDSEPTEPCFRLTPGRLKYFCGESGFRLHIAFTAFLTILAIIVLIVIVPHTRKYETKLSQITFRSLEQECQTYLRSHMQEILTDRVHVATLDLDYNVSLQILENLDKIDPCDNFYEFACGGWKQNNPVPEYYPNWSVFTMLERNTIEFVKEIMQNSSEGADIPAVLQARNMYKNCLVVAEGTKEQNEIVLNFIWNTLESYGGWPILYDRELWNVEYFSWEISLVALIKRFRKPALLNIFSHQDIGGRAFNNSILITYPASESGATLRSGRDDYNGKLTENIFDGNLYDVRDYIVNVSKVLLEFKGVNTDEDFLNEQAFDIILLENKLHRIAESEDVAEDFRKYYGFRENYGIMSLDKLQQMIDHWVGNDNKVSFKKLLTILYAKSEVEINNSDLVYVMDIDYLVQIVHLVQNVGVRTLANYLHFYMVQEMIPMSTPKLQELYEMKLFGRRTSVPARRSDVCGNEVNKKFKFALANKYIKQRYQSPCDAMKHIREVRRMFAQIKDSFRQLRKSNKILGYILDNLTDACIGFPDWIYDDSRVQMEYDGLELNQSTYLEQVLTLNEYQSSKQLKRLRERLGISECDWSQIPAGAGAFGDSSRFKIYLTMDPLQLPFFSLGLKNKAPNYGALGTVIAHELVHALARFGWDHDESGAPSPEENCLINQYSNFSVEWIVNKTLFIDGKKTLRENFADNAGLKLAYDAFQKEQLLAKSENNSTPATLLDEFTSDQRFFLSFAQTWCETFTPWGIVNEVLGDVHSPARFRVLGALQNSDEFAQAWNCRAGTEMNPRENEREKCRLF